MQVRAQIEGIGGFVVFYRVKLIDFYRIFETNG